MSATEALTAALRRLGSHPAVTLRRLGIRGVRGSACDCPVARYLRRELSLPADDVLVSAREVTAGASVANPPPEVARFVGAFDGDGYPELEDKE